MSTCQNQLPILITCCLLFLLISCQEKDFTNGPCEFAPAHLNFAEVENLRNEYDCDDCFMEIEFMDQTYFFEGNQFESGNYRGYTVPGSYELHIGYENAFFDWRMLIPDHPDKLMQGLQVKTPLRSVSALYQTDWQSVPSISGTLQLKNYCNDRFDADTIAGLPDSFHWLTAASPLDTIGYLSENIAVNEYYYLCEGEITTRVFVRDTWYPLQARYRLRVNVISPAK